MKLLRKITLLVTIVLVASILPINSEASEEEKPDLTIALKKTAGIPDLPKISFLLQKII